MWALRSSTISRSISRSRFFATSVAPERALHQRSRLPQRVAQGDRLGRVGPVALDRRHETGEEEVGRSLPQLRPADVVSLAQRLERAEQRMQQGLLPAVVELVPGRAV